MTPQEQAVIDAAKRLTERGAWQEQGDYAVCLIGRMQDLCNAIDELPETEDGMEDHFFSKGTTLKVCAQCGHPERDHHDCYQCTCRNADDSGSCRCQRFIAKRGAS